MAKHDKIYSVDLTTEEICDLYIAINYAAPKFTTPRLEKLQQRFRELTHYEEQMKGLLKEIGIRRDEDEKAKD